MATIERPDRREDGWPTRSDIQFDTDAERLCRITLKLVEAMGASESLTKAVMALDAARNHIADHVEGKPAAVTGHPTGLPKLDDTDALHALRWLVNLKDGPHDADYEATKPLAWQFARDVLAAGHPTDDGVVPDTEQPQTLQEALISAGGEYVAVPGAPGGYGIRLPVGDTGQADEPQRTKPVAELLREAAERDPEAHAASIARGYGIDRDPAFYPPAGQVVPQREDDETIEQGAALTALVLRDVADHLAAGDALVDGDWKPFLPVEHAQLGSKYRRGYSDRGLIAVNALRVIAAMNEPAGRVPVSDPRACKYGFTEPHKLTDPTYPHAAPTIPCPHHAEGEPDA